MKEKKILLKWEDNWADEMDVQGFHVITEKAWNAFKQLMETELKFPYNIGVGSSEDIDYREYNDLAKTFTACYITDEFADSLNTLFELPYGTFPGDQILEGLDLSDEEFDSFQWIANEMY